MVDAGQRSQLTAQQMRQLLREIDSAQSALERFDRLAYNTPGMTGPSGHTAVRIVRNAITELVRAEMAIKGQ